MTAVAQVAIVHDYLTQRGGAERVVLSMMRAFPNAPLYTSVYNPDTTFPDFARYEVKQLCTDRLGLLRADHRRGLPLYPFVFTAAHVAAEVVLCSSSGFAHGVRTSGHKIVYCYTPARWLYDQASDYAASWPAPVRSALRVTAPALRAWDRRAMGRADRVLVSSTAVAQRVRKTYGLEAEVVPPPAGLLSHGDQRAVPGIEPGFLLSVGRLLAYKNVDAVVKAMDLVSNARLLVVGDGPEKLRLEVVAGPKVTLVGEVDDAELRWLYVNCAGIVSASYEDYGLTPLEAAAFGKPAAVLRFGGFLDTVVEGKTGIFFDRLDRPSIARALSAVLNGVWDTRCIKDHAAGFAEETFQARLGTIIRSVTSAALA